MSDLNPMAIFREVRRLLNSDQYDKAKMLLQPLIHQLSDDYRVFSFLGYIYHREGLFSRSVRNYKKALELNPSDIETNVNLALILNDLGKYDEAAKYSCKALELKEEKTVLPEFKDSKDVNLMFCKQHCRLGELYLRYNRSEEALGEFEKAKKLSPADLSIEIEISDCLYRMGDRKSAMKRLKTVRSKKPSLYEARVKLGHLFYLEGDLGSAVQEWDEVLLEEPDNIEAKMYLKMAGEEFI